ncbi:carbohydrate ABC transporter permease [Edaphobacillus lindanitolerans]|uniref:Carbohydrate ABC transporter membrane protein 1, CUT1 family n=1 Tax=Edaphobacillus lindanitolerans TaxID=550447 RepID=A0A1U7PMB5_9BACI|nr:sugar ABC transporter permease [Edaphobacillus lindanitolerans]SIT71293.1 carbohydrate ABC transporter membrane protein 1, CUT1 family [Edaphobacillus lindanitolerans]
MSTIHSRPDEFIATEHKPGVWERSRRARTAILYLLPSIILFSVFVFYPMFRTIYLSFFLTDQAGDAAVFVGLDNYKYLLDSPAFLNSAKATLLFVLYTVPAGILLSLFLALLANEKLRGIGFFRTIYSSTMGVSVAASSVVWLFMFHPSIGMFNRFLALFDFPQIQWLLDPQWALVSVAISTIWMNTGFSFLILLGGLQNIDEHLYESARIDGAGYFYRLRRITLPMLSPTLFFIITISLINAFQTFGQIDILTKGGPAQSTNLIVYSIYREAFVNYQFGTASAQAVFLFLCILVATILQFRFGERRVHYQ